MIERTGDTEEFRGTDDPAPDGVAALPADPPPAPAPVKKRPVVGVPGILALLLVMSEGADGAR